METTATDNATSPEVFDVLSFVEQTAYPTEFVTLFTDVVAAREYAETKKAFSDAEDSDTAKKAEDKLTELEEKLKTSSLTFKLRGFPPGIVNALIEAHSTEENPTGADAHVIAKAIISVTAGNGNVDAHTWTPEEVVRLKNNIAEGQYLKLLGGVANVVFNSAVFDQVTDAGFSGGSTDVASEL